MLMECFGNKPGWTGAVKMLAAFGADVGSNRTDLARERVELTFGLLFSSLFENACDARG